MQLTKSQSILFLLLLDLSLKPLNSNVELFDPIIIKILTFHYLRRRGHFYSMMTLSLTYS